MCQFVCVSYVPPYFRLRMIRCNLSKYQWLFTKLSRCIDIVGLGQLYARNMSIFSFPGDNLGESQWIITKLDMCIDIVETCFGIANEHILLILDRVTCPTT